MSAFKAIYAWGAIADVLLPLLPGILWGTGVTGHPWDAVSPTRMPQCPF